MTRLPSTDHTPVATHDLGNGVQWVSYRDGGIVVTLPGRGVFTLASIDAFVTAAVSKENVA